jgi:subtilisin family serine protease
MKTCQEPQKLKTQNTQKKSKSWLILAIIITQLLAPSALALEPLDTFFTQQTYLTQIQANRAWNDIRESPEVIIAVLDTGVDIGNKDLIGNIWQNKGEFPGNGIDDDGNGYIDDIHGWDFTNDTNNVKPQFDEGFTKTAMNHGTLVAGVIAAEGGNDIGIAGVTWQAKIMPLRVLDGAGAGNTLSVARAINYARDNGADIINLSFIGDESSQTLALAIENAYKAGIFISAAAGNEVAQGQDLDLTPKYPVCEDGFPGQNWIIGVAGVNLNDQLGSFSNYGHDCIDISAPGLRIFSTQFVSQAEEGFTQPYGGYWTGTSVAAPQVAGVAALVKALNPDITLPEWQRLILDNADDIENLNPAYPGKLGAGRLNAFKTVIAAIQFSPQTIAAVDKFIITAAGPGGGPHVRVFDLAGNVSLQFFAYDADFAGGVYASLGDLDSDGQIEIVTTPQSDFKPEVKVFNKFGQLQNSFLAYDESFTSGLKTMLADVTGDGSQEIITVPLEDGGPHVRVFDINGNLISEFFAYNKFFKGGVDIATADLDSDGTAEIITVPGPGTSPEVRIFDYQGKMKDSFLAFEPNYFQGLTISAWRSNIVVGKNAGSDSEVKIFDHLGRLQNQWLAYDQNFKGGINVFAADLNDDGTLDITTGPKKGGGPHLRIFSKDGTVLQQWMAYNPGFRGGISVNGIK